MNFSSALYTKIVLRCYLFHERMLTVVSFFSLFCLKYYFILKAHNIFISLLCDGMTQMIFLSFGFFVTYIFVGIVVNLLVSTVIIINVIIIWIYVGDCNLHCVLINWRGECYILEYRNYCLYQLIRLPEEEEEVQKNKSINTYTFK